MTFRTIVRHQIIGREHVHCDKHTDDDAQCVHIVIDTDHAAQRERG